MSQKNSQEVVLSSLLEHAQRAKEGKPIEVLSQLNFNGFFTEERDKKVLEILKKGHNHPSVVVQHYSEKSTEQRRVKQYIERILEGAYAMPAEGIQLVIKREMIDRLKNESKKLINDERNHGTDHYDELLELNKKIHEIKVQYAAENANIMSFEEIEEKPVEWIIPGMLAKGMLHVLGGVQGHGKSLYLIDLASRASQGKKWPITGEALPQGETLYITDEDSRDKIIKPRIKAAGGDFSKIFIPDFNIENLNLPHDISKLEGWIEKLENPLFLFLDPLVDYSNKSLNASEEASKIVKPLRLLADRKNICILYTVHFNKKVKLDSIHRIAHSYVLTSKPRLVWMIAKEDSDDDLNTKRLLLCGKTAFKPIKNMLFTIKGTDDDIPFIDDWHTTKIQTSSGMASGERRRDLKVQEAEDFLNEFKGKTQFVDDLRDLGEKRGIAKRTLYRARNGPNCDIEDDYDGKGKKFWKIK